MMFCENCGAKVSEGELFCQNCGKKIALPAAQTAPRQTQMDDTAAQQNNPAVNSGTANAPTAVAEPQANPNPYAQPNGHGYNPSVQAAPQQPQASNTAAQQNNPAVNNGAANASVAVAEPQANPNPYAQPNGQYPPQQNPYGQPQGGYYDAPKPKKPPFKLSKKMIIIGSSALAALVVLIVVICVVVSVMNSPVNRMISAINSGDYDSAYEIYDDNRDTLYGNESVIQAIQNRIDSILSDYENGTIDYDTALDKLSDINDELPYSMVEKTTLSDAYSKIYDMKNAEDNLEYGNDCLSSGDYDNAIYYYDLISEDYGDTYTKAQEQKAKAIDGLRQEYLNNAEEYIAEGSYARAINYLSNVLTDNDYFEGDETITNQINSYVDSAISKSDEYFNSEEYSKASELISDVLSCFSEGDDNYTKLNTQLEKLETETPIFLSEMDYSDTDNFYRYQGGSKDVTGISYDGDNVCTMSVSKYYDTATVEMYVKDYKKIKGTLAVETGWSGSPDSKAYLEVLNGSTVLYKSETFNGKSKAVDYEVNVTDVEWLTIRLTFVKDSGSDGFSLILADNVLYKIGSSEPDAAVSEVSKAESSKAESSAAEASAAESSKTESSKAESSKTESSKAESSKTESSKAESSKAESSKAA